MDQVQISQVKPGSKEAGLHLDKWYCSDRDHRYLQHDGNWGSIAFYFDTEQQARSARSKSVV